MWVSFDLRSKSFILQLWRLIGTGLDWEPLLKIKSLSCLPIYSHAIWPANYQVITSAFIGSGLELIRVPELLWYVKKCIGERICKIMICWRYGCCLLLSRTEAESGAISRAVAVEFRSFLSCFVSFILFPGLVSSMQGCCWCSPWWSCTAYRALSSRPLVCPHFSSLISHPWPHRPGVLFVQAPGGQTQPCLRLRKE